MNAALFELTSWMGKTTYLVKSKTVSGLIDELEKFQSLECLIYMGEEEGDDQNELLKLSEILKASRSGQLLLASLAEMDVHLTPGSIKCLGVAKDGDKVAYEYLEKLKQK